MWLADRVEQNSETRGELRVRLCLVNDMTGNDWFGSQVIRWKSIKETESPSIQLRSGQTEVMWGCEFRLILAQGANCSSLVNIEDQDQWPVWDQAHAYIAYSLFSISPPVADQLNEESNVKCHLTWLFLATEISLDAKCLGGELILCLTDYCQNTDKKKFMSWPNISNPTDVSLWLSHV